MKRCLPFIPERAILQKTYRVPDRFDAPESNGIPTKQVSKPSAELWIGSRIIEAIPPERGISFGLVGKLKFLFKRLQTEMWRACKEVLSPFRICGFEPTNKRKTQLLAKFMISVAWGHNKRTINEKALESSQQEYVWVGRVECKRPIHTPAP